MEQSILRTVDSLIREIASMREDCAYEDRLSDEEIAMSPAANAARDLAISLCYHSNLISDEGYCAISSLFAARRYNELMGLLSRLGWEVQKHLLARDLF